MDLDWHRRPLPTDTRVLTTLDAHAAGEPLRIVTGGLPPLEGATMLARRRWMRDHHDDVRRALMWEPRGHFDMYGCVVTPPVSAEADIGVLFLHNEGYSTMCGHGVIALVTALVETGAVPVRRPETPVALDTPAGLVRAVADVGDDGRVRQVRFRNVPSFVYAADLGVDVPGVGALQVDVAFGGAFYAFLPAERVGLAIEPRQRAALVAMGEAVTASVAAALDLRHPDADDLGFLYGTIFTGPPEDPAHHSRHLCVFAKAEVDRSPTGTGVSARAALLDARGALAEDETLVIESLLGARSVFGVRVTGRARVGPFAAVIPEVSGQAFLTGRSEFLLDPRDALGAGFLV
jgi:proline racemase